MTGSQFRLHELTGVVKRRWKFMVLTPLVVTTACIIGAFTLTRKYESATTILVRPDQTLAPIPGYDMMMAFEEQLRNFNEIIFSRSVLQALLDSLDLITPSASEMEIQAKIKEVQGDIATMRLGSDSFRITFTDTDPVRAKRGAEIVAELFIKQKTEVENRQNDLAVKFYEEKVAEYRQEFQTSVASIVSSLRERVQEMPVENRALYAQIDEIERSLNTLDGQIAVIREKVQMLQNLPEQIEENPSDFRREGGKQALFELERSEIPYAADLRTLVLQYEELTRKYQGSYPEVVRTETQLVDLLRRMRTATGSELRRLQVQQTSLERRRSNIIEELKKTSVLQQQTQERESVYDAKRKQYDEMQQKLDQARLAMEVGSRGANQFIILDPAVVPVLPTKPNRPMIIMAGAVLGTVLGILIAVFAELLDTTVRRPSDLAVYGKPIVAFLPEWGTRPRRTKSS